MNPIRQHAQRLTSSLKHLLRTPQPSESPLTEKTERPPSLDSEWPDRNPLEQEALFVQHGPCGIVDLGASQTVIGQSHVHELLQELPKEIRNQVRKIDCNTVFRFGNSSTVTCTFAYLIPLAHWFVKLCVVPSQTPFLISNNVFRNLGAVVDTEQALIRFPKLALTMPLTLTDRQLFLLDFCSLVAQANRGHSNQTIPSPEKHAVLHAQHLDQSNRSPNETSNLTNPGMKDLDAGSCVEPSANQMCTQSEAQPVTSSAGSSDSVDARSPDRSRHGSDPSLPGGTPSHSGPDGQRKNSCT